MISNTRNMNDSFYEVSQYDSCAFVQTVQGHSSLQWLKRLAHSDSNGLPDQSILDAPPQKLVLEVSKLLVRVRSVISDASSFIKQVEIPPPDTWLKEMDLTADSYRQQMLDLFTIVTHSVTDRVLLLVNFIFDLSFPSRSCSFRNIKGAIDKTDENVGAHLLQLRAATEVVAAPRHFFVHRGEHRHVSLFSEVYRVKLITKAFHVPTEGFSFNDYGAIEELLSTMRTDLRSINLVLIPALDSLHNAYLHKIEVIGGPDIPSQEELSRATEVMKYFEGGPKPDFMQ